MSTREYSQLSPRCGRLALRPTRRKWDRSRRKGRKWERALARIATPLSRETPGGITRASPAPPSALPGEYSHHKRCASAPQALERGETRGYSGHSRGSSRGILSTHTKKLRRCSSAARLRCAMRRARCSASRPKRDSASSWPWPCLRTTERAVSVPHTHTHTHTRLCMRARVCVTTYL